MKILPAVGAALLALYLTPPLARAADLPGYLMPAAPPAAVGSGCSSSGLHRPVDHVWRPPQVAYILVERCTEGATWSGRRSDLLVYYNGGSTDRTDIRLSRTR